MANEATQLDANNLDIRQVTVADGAAIAKGSILIVGSDPNTAVVSSGSMHDIPLGVLLVEKAASDGQTTVPIGVRGDFDMNADGSITLGKLVTSGTGANQVREFGAASDEMLHQVIGTCLETASDNEYVRVRVRLG